MANNVNLPPSGTGDAGVKASTDQVSADSSQVQNVQLASVSGGVLTRNPVLATSSAAASQADGHSVAIGATTDAASSTTGSVIAHLRKIRDVLVAGIPALVGGKVPVDASGTTLTVGSHAVTNAGTFAVQADTELPAAAALGDTDANPTTPQVGAANQVFNGTSWTRWRSGLGDGAGANGIAQILGMVFNGTNLDRMRGDATNGLDVDVTRVGGNVATTSAAASQADGHSASIGSTTDAAATTTGSVIAQLRRIANLVAGTLTVSLATNTPTEVRATTGAAPTAFTATTSTQVFASNASRKLFTVTNNSDKDLYLMLASAAVSATSYHVIVKAAANGVPGFFSTSDYSGEIRGIMAATITTGQVNPGEFT